MQRRTLIAAAAALTTAATAQAAPRPRKRALAGRTFVLVHGAWHGGWCWRDVRAHLETEGARVFTPTLTGLGERAHLREPVPRLETHIADVLGVLESEELEDVTLCGHSYAGMVITGVADRAAARLRRLVYLDAALPSDGQSMITQNPAVRSPQAVAAATAQLAALAPDGVWMAPLPAAAFGLADPGQIAWVSRRLTAHPLPTWTDPLTITGEAGAGLARTYVFCTDPALPQAAFGAHAARIEAGEVGPGWRVVRLKTGHDAMVSAARDVAEILAA